jgi:CBS domain-containing protein
MIKVRDVMTTEVFAVAPDTSLEAAGRLMAQRRVTGAPVVTADGEVVGVISLSDLGDPDRSSEGSSGYSHYYELRDGFAEEFGDPSLSTSGRVGDVMTPSVVAIDMDASIHEAGRRMLAVGVHRLVVTGDDQRFEGIVSLIDLVRGFVHPGNDGDPARVEDSHPSH